jgi:hypothetical protein
LYFNVISFYSWVASIESLKTSEIFLSVFRGMLTDHKTQWGGGISENKDAHALGFCFFQVTLLF